jgi:site-specific recombinase XerD
MVKEAYKPKPQPEVVAKKLSDAFKTHNNEFAEKVAINKGAKHTLTRYERSEKKCMAFLISKYKVKDIELSELHMGIATNFYHHLLLQKINENTAMKYVKTLKQVVDRAIKEGWIQVNPTYQLLTFKLLQLNIESPNNL